MNHFANLLLGLAIVLFRVNPAAAQVLYGSLVGTVQDASGSVVPNATVKIFNDATGISRETATSDVGTYSFVDVPPGSYVVTISATGFRTAKITDVQVVINTVKRVDVQMQLGELAESVTVAAETAAVQSDKADVHVTLGEAAVTQLPLPAYRNYQGLINLVPGAAPVIYQNAVSGSPARALVTNINGTTNSSNNTRLDGASNMRASLPHQNLYVPPAESIETVNIATNSFDAEQGFAGGAAVNVVTKSGTNEFHGVIFEHHTNSSLKTRNFFYLDNRAPKDIINTYGGTIGGPIRKNKLFFFGGWEGMKERANYTRIMTVATAAQRAGDFSQLNVRLYDPMSGNPDGTGRTPFENNMIPANRQSQPALKMQSYVPLPNLQGTSANYFGSAPVSFNRDNFDAKINYNRSEKTSIWTKYSAMKALVTSQFSLGAAGGAGMINGGGAGTGDVLMQVVAVGGVHTFSPNFLVDGTVAFSRDPLTLIGPDSGTNFGLDVLKIPGTNGPDVRSSGLPTFSIGGYETLGNSETYLPKYVRNTYFTYTANAGWTKGRHEMRFGVDVARYRVNEWHPEIGGGPRGFFGFDGSVTALRGGSSPNQFNNWAAFLLGLPQNMNKSVQPDWSAGRQWLEGYYFRDRWQASRNLTLTLGLRWEYYPLTTQAHLGVIRYDYVADKVLLGGRGNVPTGAGVEPSKKLFAPRLGLAYRMGQKAVVRAGYGISIDPYPLTAGNTLLFPYPIAVNQTWSGATAYNPFGRLEQGIPQVAYPDLSQGIVDLPKPAGTGTLDKGTFRRGYIQSFNLVVERQMPGSFLVSAGYVGTRTIRQFVSYNINAAPINGGNPGRPLAQKFGRTVDINIFEPLVSANYNSLQMQADRRMAGGMLVKISYTFSKAIDLTDGSGGGLMFYDPTALARNRALSGFDRTHIFRAAWVADLPFGAGKHWVQSPGLARKVLGGWQVNGIFSSYSGTPFTVSASGASLNAPGNSQTADQVKPQVQKLGGIGINTPFYDPSAFVPVTAVRFGNSDRNILRGPGLVNVDASLFRNFPLSERFKLQFRAEAFNVSNTPHFNNPGANVSSGGFMAITSALSTANNVEGGERQFRFAVRISF